MAKKKKQKKQGLSKHKQAKQNKRSQQKRKEAALSPKQRKMSMGKVKKNLKNLPVLVYEPELEAIGFTKEQIETGAASGMNLPDQIDAATDADFDEKLKAGLSAMGQRFEAEGESDKIMMSQAMLYFLEQGGTAPCMNQITVGLFLKALHSTEEEVIPFEKLLVELDKYDEDYKVELEAKAQELEQATAAASIPGSSDIEVEAEPVELSELEALLPEFQVYLETATRNMSEDQRERAVEDAEALLVDYAEDKEIESLADLGARKVKQFIENWFIRNMNPTPDDVNSMVDSLNHFYDYAAFAGKLDGETVAAVKERLADKNAILEKLNA